MLPESIVLPVDEANNATIVNETLSRFDVYPNRSTYVGENHTPLSKDTLTFYRTANKPAGNFRGVVRTAQKFSRDQVVLGVDGVSNITAPIITEISMSIPVGVADADILLARQRAIALLDLDAVMDPHQIQLMI